MGEFNFDESPTGGPNWADLHGEPGWLYRRPGLGFGKSPRDPEKREDQISFKNYQRVGDLQVQVVGLQDRIMKLESGGPGRGILSMESGGPGRGGGQTLINAGGGHRSGPVQLRTDDSEELVLEFEPKSGMPVWDKLTRAGPFMLVQPYEHAHGMEVPVSLQGSADNCFHQVRIEDSWIMQPPKGENMIVRPIALFTPDKPPRSWANPINLARAVGNLTPGQWAAMAFFLTALMSGLALYRTF